MGKKSKKQKAPARRENPRRAIFALSAESFMSLFNGEQHFRITENPLPPSAKIMDARLEMRGMVPVLEFCIEHPSIPELVEGQPVPYAKPPVFEAVAAPEVPTDAGKKK